MGFKFFLASNIACKRAQIVLFLRYLEYQSWLKVLRGTSIRAVIIDYDILFPKALSLALENLGVRTFSLQERPTSSLYHLIYGVICDIYAYSGRLWQTHGEANKSIICNRSLNFGSWRSIFFEHDEFQPHNLRFHKSRQIKSDRKTILFLGYFLDADSPVANLKANTAFFEYVETVANDFSHCDIVVRMKSLSEELFHLLLMRFNEAQNVFISVEYDLDGISYKLCNEADAIVSVQTSLAEEALAFGRHVVLIDDLYTIKRMCSDIYPPEFRFLIAQSKGDVVNSIRLIFSGDRELLTKYEQLKEVLAGDRVFPGMVMSQKQSKV